MASELPLVAKPWDHAELRLGEALGEGYVIPCSLKSTDGFPLHPFFARDRWQAVSDEDYATLLPSMQLASNLIQAGMPYLCNFVPSSRVHDHLGGHDHLGSKDHDPQNSNWYQVDPQDCTEEGLNETREELQAMAEYVEWELNDTMATDNKWMGVTRLVMDDKWGPRPWRDLERDDIQGSDQELRDIGGHRRRLKIGIMEEYVDALKKYQGNSEEHLRAIFLAAVTMTHEVGHIVWHQDFRSIGYNNQGVEPYYGDYSISELGCYFIASIFNGFNPSSCDKQVPVDFTKALCWERIPTIYTDELYRTDYSISIPYIQKLLLQDTWDELDPTHPDFLVDAQDKVHPDADPNQTPATAVVREWTVTELEETPKVIWKVHLSDRRMRGDERLKEVTEAEKNLAMYEISLTNPGVFDNKKIPLPIIPHDDTRSIHNDTRPIDHDTMSIDNDTRPIDDGVVPLDLVDSTPGVDLTALQRIEVRYRPKPGDFKEHSSHHLRPQKHQPRAGVGHRVNLSYDDWFESLDADSAQYNKDVPKDFLFGGPREQYEPADVLALIANKEPMVIATMTIFESEHFCWKHNIRGGGRSTLSSYAEQKQKLDVTKETDRALIERMRQLCLERAEQLFAGNNQALLYIRYARLQYVDNWSLDDLKERCAFDGLDPTGTLSVLRQRVRENMAMLLKLFAESLGMSATEQVFKDAGLVDGVNLMAWTDAQFIDFFHIHSLPDWGDRRIWFKRHAAFEREQTYGLARRSDINYDTKGEIKRSVNLVETYAWDAVLAGSSVQALKEALLDAGMFPADSTLELYFRNDRRAPLEDNKPLAYYEPAQWEQLSLEITRTSQEEKPDTPMVDVQPTVLVYTPRIPAGIDIGMYNTNDHEDWKDYGQVQRPAASNDTDAPPLPKPRIPKDVQRIYDLTHGKARPTILERLEEIQTHADELSRILKPHGGRDILHPHLNTMRSTSVIEILDNYEDMKEEREDRQRHIDMQVDPEATMENERMKKRKLFEELRPDLRLGRDGQLLGGQVSGLVRGKKGGGFMRDFHVALKRRQGIL